MTFNDVISGIITGLRVFFRSLPDDTVLTLFSFELGDESLSLPFSYTPTKPRRLLVVETI